MAWDNTTKHTRTHHKHNDGTNAGGNGKNRHRRWRMTQGVPTVTKRNALIAAMAIVALAISAITLAMANAVGTNAGPVGGTIAENLDGNYAHATMLRIDSVRSGTAPWDNDDDAGDDSTPDNDIIRSFDTASYDLHSVFDVKQDSPYSYIANGYVGYKVIIKGYDTNGSQLDMSKKRAWFDEESLGWVSTDKGYEKSIGIEKVDGHDCIVLTCWRHLEATDSVPTVIPGNKDITFAIKVNQMLQGQKVMPEFYAFADHNTADAYAHITGKALTVSSAPRLNIGITSWGSGDAGYGNFDFSTGNDTAPNKDAGVVHGKRTTAGIYVEIRNNLAGKQMRGVEVPVGGITFDVILTTRFRSKSADNKTLSDWSDETEDYTPLVWTVDNNRQADVRSDGRDYACENGGASYNNANNATALSAFTTKLTSSNYTAGRYTFHDAHWSGKQSGNVASVTLDDSYVVDMISTRTVTTNSGTYQAPCFPWCYSGSNDKSATQIYNPADGIKERAIFCAGMITVVQPFNSNKDGTSILDKHSCSDGDFSLTGKIVNLRASTESGTSLPHVADNSNQVVTTDDTSTSTLNLKAPGTWDSRCVYHSSNSYSIDLVGTDGLSFTDNGSNGSDSAIAGADVNVSVGMDYWTNTPEYSPVVRRYIVKYDSDRLAPDVDQITADYGRADVNGKKPNNNTISATAQNVWNDLLGLYSSWGNKDGAYEHVIVRYLAKPDGSKWSSVTEMSSGYDADNLIAYSSMAALKATGKTCVALSVEEYCPSKATYLGRHIDLAHFKFNTLATAPDGTSNINTVAVVCNDVRMWKRRDLAATAFPGRDVDDITINEWKAYDEQLLAKAKAIPDGTAMSATDYGNTTWVAHRVYTKETYDANGKILGTHSGGCHDGDSLLLVGEQAQIAIGTEQVDTSTQKPKSIYDIDYEQRYADYYADATLTASANVTTNANTTLYYTITLPKGQTYLDNSLTYGGTYTENTPNPGTTTGGTKVTPTLTKNTDGTTTLTFNIPNVKADGTDIKRVHYTVTLGDTTNIDNDVKNGDQQTTIATIQSTNDRRKPTTTWGNISRTIIRIAKLKQQSLTNSILPRINEVNTEYTLTDTIGNYGNGQVTNMYGVTRMPWNGTGSLSAYNGTYTVTSMTLDTSKIADPTDVSFYITTDAKYRTGTYAGTNGLKKITSAETLGWVKAGYDPTTGKITIPDSIDPSKIVAWSMHKNILDKNDRMYVTTTIQPTGNAPADYYAQELTDSENVVRDIAYVASRSISGTAWKDENEDGTRQATEQVLSGIKVTLLDKDGRTAKSVSGTPLETTTADDGSYSFENVPAGDYTVRFSGTVLRNYKVTTKDVTDAGGMNDDTTDSDVNGDTNAGYLTSMQTDTITMPALKDMTTYHYAKEHVDADVILKRLGLTVNKVSNDGKALAGAKLELRDDAGTVIDSWTTGATAYKKDGILSPGKRYTIVETSAPDGYLVASPITFVTPADGMTTLVTKTMTDRIIKAATLPLSVTKTLNGKAPGNRRFTFELRDENGTVMQTAQNDDDGTVTFKPVSITRAGTRTFTITERNDGQGGVTYDNHSCKVSVTATADMLGQLHTNTTYSGREFANAYSASPTDVPVTALKVLDVGGGSSRTLRDGEFSFELRETTGGKDELLQTVQNDASGVVSFTPLHFDSAGEHSYEVREVAGDDGTVTYDNSVKSFSVSVRDDGNGKLVASASGNTQYNLRFVNSYVPKPVSVSLPVRKVVDTDNTGETLKAGEFSFVLSGSDGSVLQTVSNREDGSVSFSPLSFNHVGVFSFSVAEVDGGLAGWSYDVSLFDVRVSVSDDGTGQLSAETSITKRATGADAADDGRSATGDAGAVADGDDGTGASSGAPSVAVPSGSPVDVIEFSNSYSVSPVSVCLGAVKSLSGDLAGKPGDRRFSFELHDVTGGKNNLVQTVQNDADGLVAFAPVTFSSPGEFEFSISEVADRIADGNVSYSFDRSIHKVRVVVSNGGDGRLHASVSYDDCRSTTDTGNAGDVGVSSVVGAVADNGTGDASKKDGDGSGQASGDGTSVSSVLGNDVSVVSVSGSLPSFVNGTSVARVEPSVDELSTPASPSAVEDVPVEQPVQEQEQSDAVVQTGDELVGVSVLAIAAIIMMLAIAAARNRRR